MRFKSAAALCMALLLFLNIAWPLRAKPAVHFNMAVTAQLAAKPGKETGAEAVPERQSGLVCVGAGVPPRKTNIITIEHPLRRSEIADLSFATGVSATHGLRRTANLATGPPAA